VLFRELIGLELDYRRRKEPELHASSYLARFPQFSDIVTQAFCQPQPEQPSILVDRRPTLAADAPDTHRNSGDPDASTSRSGDQHPTPPPLVQRPPRLGRYEIVKLLGKGAFGEVYLAKDPQLERLVAIKLCQRDLFRSEANAANFLSEARKAAKLTKHPGIVTIHNVGRKGNDYYIVMDYVEGSTLADLKNTHSLTFVRVAEILAQVADAVHFAHTNGLIHRDIKPANILLDNDGHPQVVDFGLAIHESEQNFRKGEISGTLHYMSPEQATGHTERLDGRTDIWSLGATLYEFLTGRHPFTGTAREEIFDQILHRDVKPPRQIDDAIPVELEQICLKALNKQPSMRYSTARDFANELRHATSDAPPDSRTPASAAERPAVSGTRAQLSGPRFWALYAGLALVVLALLAVYLWPDFPPEPPPKPGPEPQDVEAKRRSTPPVQPPREKPQGEPSPLPVQQLTTFQEDGPFNEIAHLDEVTCVAFSVGGKCAASGDKGGLVKVWDVQTREPVSEFRVEGRVRCIALSKPEGRIVILADADPPVEVWSLTGTPKKLAAPDFRQQSPTTLLTTDKGIRVVTVGSVGMALWDAVGDEIVHREVGDTWNWVTAGSRGSYVTLAGFNADESQSWRVKQWTLRSEPEAKDVPLHGHYGPIYSLDVSDDGLVVIGGYGPEFGVCVPGRPLDASPDEDRDLYYHKVAISPSGDLVFAVSLEQPDDGRGAVVRAWYIGENKEDYKSGRQIDTQPVSGPVEAVAIHPDKHLLILAISRNLFLWRLPRWETGPGDSVIQAPRRPKSGE
jgi:serine/threonine protein kinase/WD40 repeat protein